MQDMQETWVQSLAWEYRLQKEMTNQASISVWEIPRTEEPGGLQSMGLQSQHDWTTEHVGMHILKWA